MRRRILRPCRGRHDRGDTVCGYRRYMCRFARGQQQTCRIEIKLFMVPPLLAISGSALWRRLSVDSDFRFITVPVPALGNIVP